MPVTAFIKNQNYRDKISENSDQFALDLIDLFANKRFGHMEKWSYASPAYPNDPAGGTFFWEEMVKSQNYYPAAADIQMIHSIVKTPSVLAILSDIVKIVELGPGSFESVEAKTIPFLSYAQHYTAVDINRAHAEQAARQIQNAMGIPVEAHCDDYIRTTLDKADRPKTGFIMWGSSIGNIEGKPGESCIPRLVESLRSLAEGCNHGDSVFLSIDMERRQETLLRAYNSPLASSKMLSLLHAAKRDGVTNGHFTPETWTHKSVWHADANQCAHYLISGEDQSFFIKEQHISIKAGQTFNIINSYKFTQAQILAASESAGFRRIILSDNRPVALLIATK